MRGNRRIGVGFAALAVSVGAAGCWPAPAQGPDRAAYNSFETTLTAANVASLTEKWSASMDDAPHDTEWIPSGQPVVGRGGVYVNDGSALYRFDIAGGARAWKVPLPSSPPGLIYEMGQPFVLDDQVVVGFGAVGDSTGAGAEWHNWRLNPTTGAKVADGPESGAVTGSRGSKLLTVAAQCLEGWGCGAHYTIVDPSDPDAAADGLLGSHLTKYQPPVLGASRVYHSNINALTQTSQVQAFPVSGGTTALWTTPVEFNLLASGPVLSADGSRVYVVSLTFSGAATLYALNAATGVVEWTGPLSVPATGTPALAEGRLYIPTTTGIVVMDAAGCGDSTCAPLWSGSTESSVSGQPSVAGGVVYAGTHDGTVAAFDAAGCGTETCSAVWSDSIGSAITATPVVSGGQLYVMGGGELTAFGLP